MKWFVFLVLIAGSVLIGVVRSVVEAARSFDDEDVWDTGISGFRSRDEVLETGSGA